MNKPKKSLKRSLYIGVSVFLLLLCVLFSFLTYRSFSNAFYSSYNKRMNDILEYVERYIDNDDLSKCVETNVESKKFKDMSKFMDSIMEDFDIHYLYIVYPNVSGKNKGMVNVFSADTAEGRRTDPDGFYLGYVLKDVYTDEDLQKYQDALGKNKISYFKDSTSWGNDYTAVMPLINNQNEHYALLCVDVEVYDIQRAIVTYTIINVILIIVLGSLFLFALLKWLSKSVINPIGRLEKSVVGFAERSHEQPNPDVLYYDDPYVRGNNEVESLANAISQLTEDLRSYVKNVLDAEGRVEDMKTQVKEMDMLAYQDALTRVKNKAWYDKVQERINEEIQCGTAEFGIIMADLNNMKKINDTYGHERGNDYIAGACHEICVVFDHSPVFRVGGDEFVVLLERNDYINREFLLEKLKLRYADSYKDESKEPWERYSVALGMSVYEKGKDHKMKDVFRKADDLMYEDKLASRMARE